MSNCYAWLPEVFFRFLEINTQDLGKMNWKAKNDSTLPYFCEQDDSAADLGVPHFQTNPNNPSPVLRSLVLRSRTPEAPSEWWLWGKNVANLRAKWSLGRPPAFFCCFKDIHPMIPQKIFFKIPQVTKCLTSTQSHQCFETQLRLEDSSAGRGSKYRSKLWPKCHIHRPAPELQVTLRNVHRLRRQMAFAIWVSPKSGLLPSGYLT